MRRLRDFGCTGRCAAWPRSTGDPVFAVPFSLLGVPAISLPVLQDKKLPLGLQVTGFVRGDAATFAVAAWLVGGLRGTNE